MANKSKALIYHEHQDIYLYFAVSWELRDDGAICILFRDGTEKRVYWGLKINKVQWVSQWKIQLNQLSSHNFIWKATRPVIVSITDKTRLDAMKSRMSGDIIYRSCYICHCVWIFFVSLNRQSTTVCNHQPYDCFVNMCSKWYVITKPNFKIIFSHLDLSIHSMTSVMIHTNVHLYFNITVNHNLTWYKRSITYTKNSDQITNIIVSAPHGKGTDNVLGFSSNITEFAAMGLICIVA